MEVWEGSREEEEAIFLARISMEKIEMGLKCAICEDLVENAFASGSWGVPVGVTVRFVEDLQGWNSGK